MPNNTERPAIVDTHRHPWGQKYTPKMEERGLLDPKQGFPHTNALDLMAYREVFDLDYAMPIQREGGITLSLMTNGGEVEWLARDLLQGSIVEDLKFFNDENVDIMNRYPGEFAPTANAQSRSEPPRGRYPPPVRRSRPRAAPQNLFLAACLLRHLRVLFVPFRKQSQSRFLNLSVAYFSGFGSMPKKGHSEEQILLLRGLAGPRSTRADTSKNICCGFHGNIQEVLGLGLSELRELRQLREENGKLKRLVADLSLDRHICSPSAHVGQRGVIEEGRYLSSS